MSNKLIGIFSCLHFGEKHSQVDAFKESLYHIRRRKAGIALIGDLLDCGVAMGTAHSGSVFDNVMNPDAQMDYAVKLLRPYKNQIKVILSGNHEERIQKTSSVLLNKRIARELGIPSTFRDTSATLNINNRRIFFGHGSNKGDFTRVMMGHEGLDLIACGHTHELSNSVVVRKTRSGDNRPVHLLRCGTYLKEPRYGRMALYPPNPIGGAWVTLNSGIWVDLGVRPRGV